MTTTTDQAWTVNNIQHAMRQAGSHWWDPATMRSFQTWVLPQVFQGPGGIYFVTRDPNFYSDDDRGYTVRRFCPETLEVVLVGYSHRNFEDRNLALDEAAKLAGEGHTFTSEMYRNVSDVEQLRQTIEQHAGQTVSHDDVLHLVRLATNYGDWCVEACNRTLEDYELEYQRSDAQEIEALALMIGCTGTVLGGDPRGCTAKLTFQDGHTDDMGQEGLCIPTLDNEEDDE